MQDMSTAESGRSKHLKFSQQDNTNFSVQATSVGALCKKEPH